MRETNEISKSDMCPHAWNQWNFGKLSFWKPGTKSLELKTNFEKNKTPNFYRVFDSMVNSFDNLWGTFTVCIKSLRYSKRVKKNSNSIFLISLLFLITHFYAMGFSLYSIKTWDHFYTPWKLQKTVGDMEMSFWCFQGVLKDTSR